MGPVQEPAPWHAGRSARPHGAARATRLPGLTVAAARPAARRFALDGPAAVAASDGGGLAAAAAVAAHPATSAEVRALCGDLQVLGRSEFKQLLKWCARAPPRAARPSAARPSAARPSAARPSARAP